MKLPVFAKVIPLVVVLLSSGGLEFAKAGITAQTALNVFAREKGAKALENVVAVRATRGQDQPAVWEIIANDATASGDAGYLVDGKRILKIGRVKKNMGGSPVDLRALKVDSHQAFRIADAEARKAKVGFDSIDYQLRAVPLGYAPIWLVRLRDAGGRETAVVEINGTNGLVTGGKWGGKRVNYGHAAVANAPRRQPEREPVVEESASEMHAENRQFVDYASYRKQEKETTPEEHREALGGLWQRSTKGLGSAGTRARTGFAKIGSAIADVFRGRAEYRPSGQRRWSPNRGATSRGN